MDTTKYKETLWSENGIAVLGSAWKVDLVERILDECWRASVIEI